MDSLQLARELWPSLSQTEQDVIKQIVEVAKIRKVTTGWKPETVIGYVRGEFRNRAHVREAIRFREYYSPGGPGENRDFSNLTLRWRNWLKGAPTADTVVAMGQRSAGGRGPGQPLDAAAMREQVREQMERAEAARAARRARNLGDEDAA